MTENLDFMAKHMPANSSAVDADNMINQLVDEMIASTDDIDKGAFFVRAEVEKIEQANHSPDWKRQMYLFLISSFLDGGVKNKTTAQVVLLTSLALIHAGADREAVLWACYGLGGFDATDLRGR